MNSLDKLLNAYEHPDFVYLIKIFCDTIKDDEKMTKAFEKDPDFYDKIIKKLNDDKQDLNEFEEIFKKAKEKIKKEIDKEVEALQDLFEYQAFEPENVLNAQQVEYKLIQDCNGNLSVDFCKGYLVYDDDKMYNYFLAYIDDKPTVMSVDNDNIEIHCDFTSIMGLLPSHLGLSNEIIANTNPEDLFKIVKEAFENNKIQVYNDMFLKKSGIENLSKLYDYMDKNNITDARCDIDVWCREAERELLRERKIDGISDLIETMNIQLRKKRYKEFEIENDLYR